ncbi:6-phospho-3-hexuloisomerase [Paenibacillus sp. SN-8-1]|uniref:6-phospho-3-hexuloisomerase n=1 Tax=Paenibacillus sp. SN-8-1 TaxID=3435409 RepID=UPI003D9A1CF6
MRMINYANKIIRELEQAVDHLPAAETEFLAERILAGGSVFVAGAGRSGLMTRAFAMRLMHMGIPAYVVGETSTPGLEEGDILLIGSGSGETKSLLPMAEKAKSLGGTLVTVTINPDSTLGVLSDITVKLPGVVKDKADGTGRSIQPMGSLFEQMLLIFFDALILRLMEKKGQSSGKMFGRHANLE